MNLHPNLTFLFDLDPQIGLQRSLQKLQKKNLDESRFEKEHIEFHTRVRNGFLTIAKFNPARIVTINADRKPEEIHREVVENLQKHLDKV
jgi:dTMP kinase